MPPVVLQGSKAEAEGIAQLCGNGGPAGSSDVEVRIIRGTQAAVQDAGGRDYAFIGRQRGPTHCLAGPEVPLSDSYTSEQQKCSRDIRRSVRISGGKAAGEQSSDGMSGAFQPNRIGIRRLIVRLRGRELAQAETGVCL